MKDPLCRNYRIINTGESIEEDDRMEFRLLYQGELLSASRDSPRSAHKHAIRKAFHPQLRRLWNTERNLKALAEHYYIKSLKGSVEKTPETPESRIALGINSFAHNWRRNGFSFVPLVTSRLVLRCNLEILILRPEGDRFIFKRGDIDAQMKTLFDALRIPSNGEDTGGNEPATGEEPFFCLLEDDRLITEVRIMAEPLLLLPNQDERECRATDSFVLIHVRLNHRNPGAFDNYFG